MRTNRTHTAPPKIEELGDGTFYYNFNIDKTELRDDSGQKYDNYDYDQVRVNTPVEVVKIQEKVNQAGFDHVVKMKGE